MGRRVLVMYSVSVPQALLQLTLALEVRGVEVCRVLTPGEVLWHLEGGAFAALIVYLPVPSITPDRIELLRFMRKHRPLLTRIAITPPGNMEEEDCIEVPLQDILRWSGARDRPRLNRDSAQCDPGARSGSVRSTS